LKLFSERKGLKKVQTEIQIDYINDALRNKLWNMLKTYYWDKMETFRWIYQHRAMEVLFKKMWHYYFKKPFDTMPEYWEHLYREIREYFLKCAWYEVYDFLEFIVANFPDKSVNEKFKEACNIVLEEELSGYRFVGNQITEMTAKEEISEIEEALESPIQPAKVHIENALRLMSDRKAPDYRNSIKESISAVEATCRIITKDEKATLGKALDSIERQGKIEIHPALKKAFDSLYGYTSSAEGIRHALLDEKVSVGFEDAKFMLVSCSAFVNFLVSKALKAKIL
jgi:uncharacterized protein with PIN domain